MNVKNKKKQLLWNLFQKNIRIINMTKFECRLSIIPPKHREFDVEIRSPRGLTITSGATVELVIRFKPSDVRVMKDELIVKVSRGQTCSIPIACYMQPPLLDSESTAWYNTRKTMKFIFKFHMYYGQLWFQPSRRPWIKHPREVRQETQISMWM